jgi:hypothetical protein
LGGRLVCLWLADGLPQRGHRDAASCGRSRPARRRRVHAAHVRCPETVRPAGHPDRLISRRSRLGSFLSSCGPPARIQDGAGDARSLRARLGRALPREAGARGWPEACHGEHARTPRPRGRSTIARRRRVLRPRDHRAATPRPAAHTRCPETVRPAGRPGRLTSRRSRPGCFLSSCGPPARIQDGAGDARILRARVGRAGCPVNRVPVAGRRPATTSARDAASCGPGPGARTPPCPERQPPTRSPFSTTTCISGAAGRLLLEDGTVRSDPEDVP